MSPAVPHELHGPGRMIDPLFILMLIIIVI